MWRTHSCVPGAGTRADTPGLQFQSPRTRRETLDLRAAQVRQRQQQVRGWRILADALFRRLQLLAELGELRDLALFAHSPRIAPAPKHSAGEDRLIAVGRTRTGRPVFVAFTIRTKNKRRLIRPVTARHMHAKEIAAYEKESPTT